MITTVAPFQDWDANEPKMGRLSARGVSPQRTRFPFAMPRACFWTGIRSSDPSYFWNSPEWIF